MLMIVNNSDPEVELEIAITARILEWILNELMLLNSLLDRNEPEYANVKLLEVIGDLHCFLDEFHFKRSGG